MIENPRFFKISAQRFDGTTRPAAPWQISAPGNTSGADTTSRNEPSSYLRQEAVGRLAFSDIFRPGVLGGVVWVRALSLPEPGAAVTLRSAAADELPPGESIITNQPLDTFPLTRLWSTPKLLGPTDAISIKHLPAQGDGAVELMAADLKGHLHDALVNALAYGVLSVFGRTGHVIAEAGDYNAAQISYASGLGADAAAALDGLLNQDFVATITNNVAGATVAAPALVRPWQPHGIEFTENGAIQLPLLSSVPRNYAYLFFRTGGGAIDAGLVEIIPSGTDLLDGRPIAGNPVNGGAYMQVKPNIGTAMIVRATSGGWVSSGGFSAVPLDTLNADTTLERWSGHREIIMSSAAARVLTLPGSLNVSGQGMPRGSTLSVVSFVGAHTIAAGGGAFYGSANGATYNGAANVPLAAQASIDIEYFSPNIWRVH